MISVLIKKDCAYESNGSVYFDTSKFGKCEFTGLKERFDNEERNLNTSIESEEKRNNRDFALWKAVNPQHAVPQWSSPFGNGRPGKCLMSFFHSSFILYSQCTRSPGWHIECSAICSSLLGDKTIDIHAGGIDLVFPHHCNEIAQSEAYSGLKIVSSLILLFFVIFKEINFVIIGFTMSSLILMIKRCQKA
jgi:cysteinyl-tRNA synthetase